MKIDELGAGISLPLGPIEIMKYQQNRFPLLLIDKVVSLTPGEKAEGVKCFSFNEWFFPAHFEDEPVVPGFILVESLVQTFLMTFLTLPGNEGSKTAFVEISRARFRGKVVPGDCLNIKASLESFSFGLAIGKSSATVDGQPVVEADFRVGIPSHLQKFLPVRGV